MIGLYTQNTNTLAQLLDLLRDLPIEAYEPSNKYEAVIWLSNTPAPHDLTLLPLDESLPLTFTQWRSLLQIKQATKVQYQNTFFLFDALSRTITDLKTKKQILLTEKETDLIIFLVQSQNHQATKEQVLQEVWQYTPEIQTHTLESHIYTLKQKLGAHADDFIQLKNGCLFLT
ncbi:MAG: winged helix-turn-helix transcriptional regulator [Alphaproteobacteria bacterium]|nr:winged helix-turn-helix transcriptional regulator [Alphaproteobacteria bacterium]